MALFQKYCLCGQPYDICKFMIQCDHCKEWFHGSCVSVKEYESRDIEKFHCPRCQPTVGSNILKERKNWHRHDFWDAEATHKPIQSGTAVFVRELKQRTFPLADEEVVVVRGQHLTLPYFVQNGFDRPILIPSKDGLGILMPPESFTVNDIMDYVGEDCILDAIDVGRQEDVKMPMKDWVTYYNSPERDKIYNVISLEFSNNRLSDLVRPPSIVQKLSWVESYWPDPSSALAKKLENQDNSPIRPQVMKYCLMGTEDSYTDFHIDFGGTSVWYHILQGEKIFYLIRPSPENLEKYEKWMLAPNQSETFFGDLVDVCHKLIITRGQTLFIPSGWIHAVLTPVDSMVFGGNFLCSMNIPLQLKVHEMEGRIKTPHKYKFPSFEDVHWYAAPNIAQHLRDFNEGNRRAPPYLLQGAKTIANLLKSWLSEKEEKRKFPAPQGLNPQKIIKDLGREVRMAERQLTVKGRADREKRLKDLISSPAKTRKTLLRRSVQPLTPKTSNIEPTEINVLNESKVLESSHSKQEETELSNSNSPTVDDDKSTPQKTVVPVSPSKSTSISGNVGRTFATTNAARRKAAAANRSNALKMKLNAEGKPPLKDGSHVVTPKQLTASRNPQQKDSVYDFVDSDEDTLIVDEKPKGKRKNNSPLVQAVSCDIQNNSVSIGLNGNFKQRMIARNEQNKASPAIVTTSEGLPIARKSAPGPPVPTLKLPPQSSPSSLPDHTAHGTLRLKLSINGVPSSEEQFHQLQPLREVNTESLSVEQDNSFNQTESPSSVGSKNGGTLDTLLLACDYAGDPESSRISLEDDLSNSGRASPSTREAIQGMLSMSKSAFTFGAQNLKETSSPSSTYLEVSSSNNLSSLMDSRLMGLSLLASKCPTNASPPSSPSFHTRSPAIGMRGMTQVGSRIGTRSIIGKRKFPKEDDDFEASLKNCHQDKDFIYFDLDTTEEDQNIFKRRGGRATHDESWSPRARVNISCPKPERPSREGARKEAIESGLAAAAAKLADLPPPKRPYHRKKQSHPLPKKEIVEEFTNPSTSSGSALVISTTVKKTPSGDSSPPQLLGGKKPRKGFATAKQRLGKILKIHKMLH